ncbi:MAG: hypothetical protein RLY86_2591 [Pseudomonadota bacterium]|jgi:hypothetical protein
MDARSLRAGLAAGTAMLALTIGVSLGTASPAMAQSSAAGGAASEVQELRQQVQQLLSRIETLEKAQAAAPAPAPAAPTAAAPAPAPTPTVAPVAMITQGNQKVKVTLGGWLNRALVYGDNGADSDVLFVDNNGASSRLTLTASGQVTERLSFGSVLEMEAISNNSRTTNIKQSSSAMSFNERKMEVWAEMKGVGRLWVGQGDMATQAIAEVDLSGTGNLGLYSDLGATFGGLAFNRTRGTGPQANINAAMPHYDGFGNARDDRIRLDTTNLNGFVLSTSVSHDGNSDLALRYTGKVGDTNLAAAVGYGDWATRVNAANDDLLAGSISARFASGFTATVAAGRQGFRAANRDTGSFIYGKVGYIAKLTPIGDTAFAVDYYDNSDTVANGSEGTAYGFTIAQQLTPINSEVYFGIRNHELSAPGTNYDDVLAILTGARIRF